MIDKYNWGKIDLLKIDVERMEGEVLEGYQKYLKRHIPVILIEILSKKSAIKIQKLLDPLGYSYSSIEEGGGPRKTPKITDGAVDQNYLLIPPE